MFFGNSYGIFPGSKEAEFTSIVFICRGTSTSFTIRWVWARRGPLNIFPASWTPTPSPAKLEPHGFSSSNTPDSLPDAGRPCSWLRRPGLHVHSRPPPAVSPREGRVLGSLPQAGLPIIASVSASGLLPLADLRKDAGISRATLSLLFIITTIAEKRAFCEWWPCFSYSVLASLEQYRECKGIQKGRPPTLTEFLFIKVAIAGKSHDLSGLNYFLLNGGGETLN